MKLYHERAMTQAEIAGVLGTDQATISRDIGIMQMHKTDPRGRPRKQAPEVLSSKTA